MASAIHSYLHHGDPMIRALVHHALTQVAQPVFTPIVRWIYDGELEDTYHEVRRIFTYILSLASLSIIGNILFVISTNEIY